MGHRLIGKRRQRQTEGAGAVGLSDRRKLWVDVGPLLEGPDHHVTGTERTVLSILCALRDRFELPFHLHYCQYISNRGFREIANAEVEACILRLVNGAGGFWPSLKMFIGRLPAMVYRHIPPRIKPQLRNLYFAIVDRLYMCQGYLTGRSRSLSHSSESIFSHDDILLALIGNWNPKYTAAVEDVKRQGGVRYVAIFHDIIPWKWPAFVTPELREEFVPAARRAIRATDLLLASSKCTRADIMHFMTCEGEVPKNAEVIRLGDIPPYLGQRNEAVRQPIRSLGKVPYVLVVGTIEIRKNHRLLLRVWEALLAKHGTAVPMMVWAGKWGWSADNLKDEIYGATAKDPRLRKKLTILGPVSDWELHFLYGSCLFTLYPSLYEGWGLPVAESVAHGKYCVASNASSIPEIVGDLIDYHAPNDFDMCYRSVERALFDVEYRRAKEAEIRSRYKLHTWGECTDMLIEKVGACFPPQ